MYCWRKGKGRLLEGVAPAKRHSTKYPQGFGEAARIRSANENDKNLKHNARHDDISCM